MRNLLANLLALKNKFSIFQKKLLSLEQLFYFLNKNVQLSNTSSCFDYN